MWLLPRRNVLTPTVVRLGLVSFFADVSSEMLYPITPIFLTATLGASMFSVGLIEGVAESLASLLKVYAGTRSDKIRRRRPFIVLGYFLAALAKPMIGFAGSWSTVLAARAVDRTGKGIRSAPRDALLSDSVKPELQGEAFGWHRSMDTLGAAFGPLLAIFFLHLNQNQLRPLYYWALIPGLFSVFVAWSIRESKRSKDEVAIAIKPQAENKRAFHWQDSSSSFKTYLTAWTLFSLANSSDAFLILKAKQSGVSLTLTILMYCFYNLVYAFASPYLGRLSDKTSRKNILSGGLFVFAFVYAGFSFATHSSDFWLLFGIYGLYIAATDGVGKALVVDLVPREFKASAIGMLGATSGLATVAASVTAGLLWDHFGSQATFLYGASGALISAILISFVKEKLKPAR